MKITKRQLKKIIQEHLILPEFPVELANLKSGSGIPLKDVIHTMINSDEIENIRQADLLMKGFGYPYYVTDYLKNKHVGFSEKLGSEAGEIDRKLFPSDPNMSGDERLSLSQRAREIDDSVWIQSKTIAQQTNPNFEEDETIQDDLIDRFYRTKGYVSRKK